MTKITKKFKDGGYFKSEEIMPGVTVMEMDGKGFVEKFVNTSYTCCNIEVSEPAGTEVLCKACCEWCKTKTE